MRAKRNATPVKDAVTVVGGCEAAGRICGISGKAVSKWVKAGRLPRTEATGETNYAELLSIADSRIDKTKLLATVFARRPMKAPAQDAAP